MSTRKSVSIVVLSVAAALFSAPVLAQAPTQPRPADPPSVAAPARDSRACAPNERATMGQGNIPQTHLTPQDQPPADNLSDKLARTDGVICPPENIDPGIRAPAPGGGAMPVIRPPGSPGGDPSVRPK